MKMRNATLISLKRAGLIRAHFSGTRGSNPFSEAKSSKNFFLLLGFAQCDPNKSKKYEDTRQIKKKKRKEIKKKKNK